VPTYQYACTECGEQIEMVQKFSDDPLTVCPVCGGRLRKVFSPVGIVFKGSGFYRTDSRAGNGALAGAKDKQNGQGTPAGEAGSGGTGTDGAGPGDKKAAAASSSPGSSSPGTSPGSSGSSGSAGEKVA
jgi:putative FmdB family regulatory protein